MTVGADLRKGTMIMSTSELKHGPRPRQQRMKRKAQPTTGMNVPLATAILPANEFFVTIPTVETFTSEEKAAYEAGEYTLRICEHLPPHEGFLDFLVEQGVAEWRRILIDEKPANDVDPTESDRKGGR